MLIAHDRGRLNKAEGWYRKALAIEEKLDDEQSVATTYHRLEEAAFLRRRLDDGIATPWSSRRNSATSHP